MSCECMYTWIDREIGEEKKVSKVRMFSPLLSSPPLASPLPSPLLPSPPPPPPPSSLLELWLLSS